MLVRVEGRLDQVGVEVLGGQSANRDHPRDAARGISAAAEPKDENVVVWIVGMRDSRIAILDLLQESQTESTAQQSRERQAVAAHTIVVSLRLLGGLLEHVEKLVDVAIAI